MVRTTSAAALSLFLILGTAGAVAASDFKVRIDGKILRKTSGKVVLSLSRFELMGGQEVILEDRKTGRKHTVPISTVYDDISYSEVLPADLFDAIDEDAWVPSVVWSIPDETDSLNGRLSAVHRYQNELRRELGNALLEGGDANVKVSSRLTLNKIAKYHRVASDLAQEILRLSRLKDDMNPFVFPMAIQVGYNPFGNLASGAKPMSPTEQVREVIYWEIYRVLTQQFGIDAGFVDLVYNSPTTLRELTPLGASGDSGGKDFFPTVTLFAKSIDAVLYLQRQRFGEEFGKFLRLRWFRDPFIRERPVLDAFVNEGKVAGVAGSRVAVTFIPPFMEPGETVFVEAGGEEGEIPLVLATSAEAAGYSLSEEMPVDLIARIRPGMRVLRR